MRTAIVKSFAVMLSGVAIAALTALPASAACTRLGFSVNDYGKDGPTKDAKALLDKYIAKWATEHKIAKYNTGPKSVSCELFLNFILFDEHTCRAEASVCWDGAPVPGTQQAKTDAPANKTDAPKAAAKAPDSNPPVTTEKAAVKSAAKPAAATASKVETGSTTKPSTSASTTSAPKTDTPSEPAKEPAKPAEEKPAN